MAAFRPAHFDDLPLALIRERAEADCFDLEVEGVRLVPRAELVSEKLGAFIIVDVRHSPPGAPAYSWATLQASAAFAALEAKRAAAKAASEIESEAAAAQAPAAEDAAGADGAGGESSPRPRRSKPAAKQSPPEENVTHGEEAQPTDAPHGDE